MRILHTSDWHLGQSLLDAPRDYEHARFLSWLLDTLVQSRVDALLITGDVFEHVNPPPAAQRAYYEFLLACRQRLPRLSIVVIGGNHDSAGRLDAPGALLRSLGVRVVGGLPRREDGSIAVEDIVIPLTGADGAVAGYVAAVPYLRRADLAGASADLSDSRLTAAVRAVYNDVLEEARRRRGPDHALIATGHCYMVGGRVSSESERRIQFGNQALPLDLFPDDVAYVALGHLHLAQAVMGHEHIRYAGSPIPLSLIEKDYPHQVVLAEFAGSKLAEVKPLLVPRTVPILVVPEEHRPLADVLPLLRALPGPAADAKPEERPFLEVRLERPPGGQSARQEVEAALQEAGAFARLLRISFPTRPNAVVEALGDQTFATNLRELDPREVLVRCYRKQHPGAAGVNDEQVPPALLTLFNELLEQVEHGDDAAGSPPLAIVAPSPVSPIAAAAPPPPPMPAPVPVVEALPPVPSNDTAPPRREVRSGGAGQTLSLFGSLEVTR